jgi:hypothetical protein
MSPMESASPATAKWQEHDRFPFSLHEASKMNNVNSTIGFRRARLALVIAAVIAMVVTGIPRSRAASSSGERSPRVETAPPMLKEAQQSRAPLGSGPVQGNGISSEGMRQIAALISEKQNRTPVEQKIDSRLLQAVRESRGQRMAEGVDLEPANVGVNDDGRLLVDIDGAVSEEMVVRLEALGADMVYTSFRYKTIRARVELSAVEAIAALPGVTFVKPAVRAIIHRPSSPPVGGSSYSGSPDFGFAGRGFGDRDFGDVGFAAPGFEARAASVRQGMQNFIASRAASSNHAFSSTAAFSSSPALSSPALSSIVVDSQGDRAHRAYDARNTYGYSGAGIKVGVLSDSFNALGGYAEDIATGNLPGPGNPLGNLTPVTVVEDDLSGSDEGRAIIEIVHDLAPKAQLFFATADFGPAAFAQSIINLQVVNHCDVIIDDVGYGDEAVFEDGIIADAVDTVTAAGALYFSAAGNEGSVLNGDAGVFEGDFNDAGSPAFAFPGGAKSGTIQNFGTVAAPVTGDIIISDGSEGFYSLFWADPLGAASDDYDLFLLDSTGAVKGASTNIQNGSQNPYEEIDASFSAGDNLVIFKTAASAKVAFHLNTNGGTLAVATTGQTHGHSAAGGIGGFSVAATPAFDPFGPGYPVGPFPNAFNSTNQVELFTSDGPRRVFFNPDGTAITPNNFTFAGNGGQVRLKPDITAADGVSNTLPADHNPFYGTSAAAPHAGAIAALLKSANPSLSQSDIRTILTTTAVDIESPGWDNVSGYGILQAFQAMGAVFPTPQGDVNLNSVTMTEGELSNHNGSVDPGESANIVVSLTDPSLVTATGVAASLATTTPGVTVLRGTASYGTIPSSSTAANTGSPFIVKIDSSVACGATIDFFLTSTFNGTNSPQVFEFNEIVGTPPINIASTLGQTPPTGTGFTSAHGTQNGRVFRTQIPSTCAAPKPYPGTVAANARLYDAYTFTNTNADSECVTVTMSCTTGFNLFTEVYGSGGFVPSDPSANYLADAGASDTTQVFSFIAPAGEPFTVVVDDVPGNSAGTQYSLSVALDFCSSAPPACPAITVAPASAPQAIAGVPYLLTFTASGGTAPYTFALTGKLPAGLTFNDGTISATPSQSGPLSVMITATDLLGCQSPATTISTTVFLNKCLRDDRTGDFILFSSTTGNYEFVHCAATDVIVAGKGTITTPNGILTITDKETNQTVTISYNPGSLTGTATVTIIPAPGLSQTYRISDTNPNPVCACGGGA